MVRTMWHRGERSLTGWGAVGAIVIAAMLVAALSFFPSIGDGAHAPRRLAAAGDGIPGRTSAAATGAAASVGRVALRAAARPPRLRDVILAAGHRLSSSPDPDERCLAQAVYFEARSEPLAGQLAVAQVVLNRVRSPSWPDSVCAVVFQNERWRHRCQFSFACDGRSDRPREGRAWRIARMVARTALDRGWPDITRHATHYHADYVRPRWRARLVETARYGRHLFYRDARFAAASGRSSPSGTHAGH